MVRLADLADFERDHALLKRHDPLPGTPFVRGPALAERRVALVTTAGLHRRSDPAFGSVAGAYRVLPGDLAGADLVMSQLSTNFDRSGFQEDLNVVFPIDRFRELEARGTIGSLSSFHLSFMGAGITPQAVEAPAREAAGHLCADGVDTVFLTPV